LPVVDNDTPPKTGDNNPNQENMSNLETAVSPQVDKDHERNIDTIFNGLHDYISTNTNHIRHNLSEFSITQNDLFDVSLCDIEELENEDTKTDTSSQKKETQSNKLTNLNSVDLVSKLNEVNEE